MADKIPSRFIRIQEEYPEIMAAYQAMGDAVHNAGPIDEKSRALIKLGISTGARLEGAVSSHTRKALNVGASREELHQVALLSLPTIGLPAMMAALKAIDAVLEDKES